MFLALATRSGTLRGVTILIWFVVCIALLCPSISRAQTSNEFDEYKVRLQGTWFYLSPTGSVRGSADQRPVDFQKDLGFSDYSIGGAKLDWKFTHKNHVYVVFVPFYSTKTTTLTRTITFQGQTFDVGVTANSSLHSFLVAPGYQYDIIRRRRGHLGLGVQVDFLNATAKINATAQVAGGASGSGMVSAEGSLLAPIPVAGPQYRLYLTNSPRVFIDGNLYGMYLFGYGNFISVDDAIGVAINKHVSVTAGYALASRANIHGSQNRLALTLTQKGPQVGVQLSF
jgi:hypothetical protein